MKHIGKITILAASLGLASLTVSCTPGEKGAVVGGVTGAAVGGAVGDAPGALVGGAVGAVAGSEIAKNRARRKWGWSRY